MGAFLDKPKTEKTTATGDGHGLRYAASAMQGWRMEMEDSHTCQTETPIKQGSLFAVFDGHAGARVAQHCSDNLLKTFENILVSKSDAGREYSAEKIKTAMYKAFLELDESMKKNPVWDKREDHSGTTAVAVFITPTHMIWANCGDSRSVFCRNNELSFATEDHKPYSLVEKTRIEKAGGTVMMQRVNGTLAVSRALGDFDYKQDKNIPSIEQLVSPEPEMSVIERNPEVDEFIVLACDGIFDVMTNQEVVEFVRHRLELTKDLDTICNDLVDNCLHKNSRDNMSVVLVTFPGAPKVSQEAIQKDIELQEEAKKSIRQKIEDLVKHALDPLDVEENHVFEQLCKELPTSYQVALKRVYVNECLHELTKNKFVNRDFTGTSDPNNAPPEMQFTSSSGTQFLVKGVMSHRDDDPAELDSFDDNLLKLSDDTSTDNTATNKDGEELEMMEVTTQGDERPQNTPSSVTSTEIQ